METWQQPLAAETDEEGATVEDDLVGGLCILAALDEIAAHEREVGKRPGDVLVFLPGEREIRDAAEMLRRPTCATPRCCRCTRDFGRAAEDLPAAPGTQDRAVHQRRGNSR